MNISDGLILLFVSVVAYYDNTISPWPLTHGVSDHNFDKIASIHLCAVINTNNFAYLTYGPWRVGSILLQLVLVYVCESYI